MTRLKRRIAVPRSGQVGDICGASLYPGERVVGTGSVHQIDGPLVPEGVAEERKRFEVLTDVSSGRARRTFARRPAE